MTVKVELGELYNTVEVDLGVEHEKLEVYCPGVSLFVAYLDGECRVTFDEPDEPPIDLRQIISIVPKPDGFKYIYITNSAQSGRKCRLLVGKSFQFEARAGRIGAVGLLNTEEIRINPATEDTLSAINGKIVKADTDNVKVVSELAYDSANDRKKVSIENDAVGLAKESTLSNILSKLDITLSALRDALLAEEVVENHGTGLDETVDQEISLDTKGHKLLEVYAKASAATTFYLDVSPDNVTWIEGYLSWSSVTEVKETLWNGFRYVRLRSAAAGASGDTVDLFLSAK